MKTRVDRIGSAAELDKLLLEYENDQEVKAMMILACDGNDFSKELAVVSTPDRPLIGALTLGEIANSGKDYLEFYNKTSVVGILG